MTISRHNQILALEANVQALFSPRDREIPEDYSLLTRYRQEALWRQAQAIRREEAW